VLHLTRRVGQVIVIDGDITVEVLEINGRNVKLGIVAPDCEVWRKEIYDAQTLEASDVRV
jgi:carbon storage regulator